MDIDLSKYEVTFRKVRLMNMWTWSAITPDGRSLSCTFRFGKREAAEQDALRAIESDAQTETMNGDALRSRLRSSVTQ